MNQANGNSRRDPARRRVVRATPVRMRGHHTDMPGSGLARIAILAIVAEVATLGLVKVIVPSETWFYKIIFERSPIQFITLFGFWVGMAICLERWIAIRKLKIAIKEGEALKVDQDPDTLETLHDTDNIVTRRRKEVSSTHIRDLGPYVKSYAAEDAAYLDGVYWLLEELIQLCPLLGFAGTVLGLGRGLYVQFVVRTAGEGTFTEAIATAFDTTLLGLACTIILTCIGKLILRRIEESRFTDLRRLVNRWAIERRKASRAERRERATDHQEHTPQPTCAIVASGTTAAIKNAANDLTAILQPQIQTLIATAITEAAEAQKAVITESANALERTLDSAAKHIEDAMTKAALTREQDLSDATSSLSTLVQSVGQVIDQARKNLTELETLIQSQQELAHTSPVQDMLDTIRARVIDISRWNGTTVDAINTHLSHEVGKVRELISAESKKTRQFEITEKPSAS